MDTTSVLAGLAAAGIAGVGTGIGLRLLPMYIRARRDLKELKESPQQLLYEQMVELERERRQLASPLGRKRDSSIVGMFESALRHADGSYTRAYHVELAPTQFSDESLVEARADHLARMLAAEKPTGTVLQFRLSAGIDPGRAILRHLECIEVKGVHPYANLFHLLGVRHYQEAASAGLFKQSVLTLWVRVPVKHANDDRNRGLNNFVPTFNAEVKRNGLSEFTRAVAIGWENSKDDGVTRRILREETEAFEEAERVFRLIERECPLELKRFSREEIWEAVYLGHIQNASTVPIPPDEPGTDLRDYLCGETISGDDWYLMHGWHPAAIVSLFTPPQPVVFANALRILLFDPSLNFRHTLIAEYVYPDQAKAVKAIDKRIRQVRRTRVRGDGRIKETPEARAALIDLEGVRDELVGGREAINKLRFYAVAYGPEARSKQELEESVRLLNGWCEQLVTSFRRIPGADASREEPAALRAIYHRALVGEADSRNTGREITETAHSLSVMIPTESPWQGSPRPHTLVSTPTGQLLGFDLYDRAQVPSPLILLIAAPRGGKSVLIARTVTDVLGAKRDARVRTVDFGESLGPLVDVLHGRHLRFTLGETRTINIWDYQGLADGIPPDEVQIGLVVGDLMQLARVPANDVLAEDILATVVAEVYRNIVPHNGPGLDKHEPVHSHLLRMLTNFPFKHDAAKDRAEALSLALEQFRDHPWLDKPTHHDFEVDSHLDVYELDSLEQFPPRVQESLAYRVAARVMRSIGQLNPDGTRTPTLLAFDEVHKIVERYPAIFKVIKKGARMGAKENVVTMLASHGYEDFQDIHDLTKTAGVKVIGKQIGGYSKLVEDAGLSPEAAGAINAIKNVPGSHAQFVAVFGAGDDKQVEMIQVDLSPTELWTFTTNPDERNARARVLALQPDWSLADAIAWLAQSYPRGLTAEKLVAIDESLLTAG